MRFLEKLWLRHGHSVFVRSLRILTNPNDAEDVTVDTFLRARSEIVAGRFRDVNLTGWLSTIAKNLSINLLQRAENKQRIQGIELADLRSSIASPETKAEVASVLSKLSDEQRVTLKLLYMHGLTYKEIAARQGWSVEEVKTYVQNGRRMFEKIWASQGNASRSAK